MSILGYQSGGTAGSGVGQDPSVGDKTGYQGALAEFAGEYVSDMLGKGRALAEQPYTAYTGPLTAGPSALQTKAFQGVGNLALPTDASGASAMGTFTPGTFSATGAPDPTGDAPTAGGSIANQYMNPYLSAVLQPQLEEARRQAEISRQAESGRFTRAGAFGGSRQALADLERDAILNRNLADITGKGYAQAFESARKQFNIEQDRERQAQDMANKFGFDVLGAQARAGEVERGIEKEGILADRAQFEEERDFPYKQLQYQRSLLQGLPIAARSYSVTQPSGFSALAGGAGDISTLLKSIFGLGGGGADTSGTGVSDSEGNTIDFSGMTEEEIRNYIFGGGDD